MVTLVITCAHVSKFSTQQLECVRDAHQECWHKTVDVSMLTTLAMTLATSNLDKMNATDVRETTVLDQDMAEMALDMAQMAIDMVQEVLKIQPNSRLTSTSLLTLSQDLWNLATK